MLVAGLVFLGVFAVLALLLFASGSGSAQRSKQTLAHLETALSTNRSAAPEQSVDVRKSEMLSTIPWINRWLQKVEVAPRLRVMLHQANLNWTAGGLMLMAAVCAVIPAYLINLRTGATAFAVLIGLLLGYAPIGYVLFRRNQRFNRFGRPAGGAGSGW